MSSSLMHEFGQYGKNGHVATWGENETANVRGTQEAEHLTSGAPSSVRVTIDWAACIVPAKRYLHQVEAATKHYGASYGLALSHALAQAGTPAERLDVDATASLFDSQTGAPTISLKVRGQARGLDQAGFERIARQAEQASTVRNAVLGADWPGTPDVRLTVMLVEQTEAEGTSGRAVPDAAPTEPSRPNDAAPVAGRVVPRPEPDRAASQAGADASNPAAARARPDAVPEPTGPNGLGAATEKRERSRIGIQGTRVHWIACGFAVALVGGIVAAQGLTHTPSVVIVRPESLDPPVTARAPLATPTLAADLAANGSSSVAGRTASAVSAAPDVPMLATVPEPERPVAHVVRSSGGLAVATPGSAIPSLPVSSLQPSTGQGPQESIQVASVTSSPTGPAATERLTGSEVAFARRPPGWPENPESTAWLASDGYHLAARHPSRFVAIRSPLDSPNRDVIVKGAFRKIGGPSGGGYGLIVRDDGRSAGDGVDQGGRYYVFEAGDRGEIGVWRREDDRWVDLLMWTRSDAVRPANAPNELEVRASGHRYTFLVNGVVVADIEDAVLDGGRVGIFAGGDLNEVVVDRFSVEYPDP
jgi:osmotically inducible protein OsmC